jgi:hypothetical protein
MHGGKAERAKLLKMFVEAGFDKDWGLLLPPRFFGLL